MSDVLLRVYVTGVEPKVTPPVDGTPTNPDPVIATDWPLEPAKAFDPVGGAHVHFAMYGLDGLVNSIPPPKYTTAPLGAMALGVPLL